MKTKIFLGMLLVGVVPLRAQDYYVVTKENVDVYNIRLRVRGAGRLVP